MKRLSLLLALSIPGCCGVAFADDPHHSLQPVTRSYTINQVVNTNGLAALYAATQLHPSVNISGIQLGGGLAEFDSRVGKSFGAALVVPGGALVSGSISGEGDGIFTVDSTVIGVGINVSIRP